MAIIDGTTGNDPNLNGMDLDDTVNGFGGVDTMRGLDGADTLVPGAGGSDTIDGGAGTDTLSLVGNFADYTIGYSGANIVLTIGATVETVTGVEKIAFADKTVHLVGSGSELTTIQSAVNAASNGDTILIAGGTYVEQVTIDGRSDIVLAAGPGQIVTIQAPADVVQNATSSSGRELHAVVAVINGTNIVLDSVNIDGAGVGDTVSGVNPNFVGVVYRNSSGGLADVDITGVRQPYEPGTTVGGHPILNAVTQGFGLQVNNDTTLPFTMTGGSVSDCQVFGAAFFGADLNVSGVTFVGGGDQTLRTQNGIQVSNSTGIITGNTFTDLGFAGADPIYDSAILAFDNANLSLADNTIVGANDENLNAKIVGIFTDTANSDITITGNSISQVDMAIIGTGNVSPVGYVVNNNTITNIDTTDAFYLSSGAVLFTPDDTAAVHNVVGSDFNDNLFGGSGADTFDGRGGTDLIDGRGGADILAGGSGNDTLNGGGGNDTLNGGADIDQMTGGTGNDTYFDTLGDAITEALGAGYDTVNTTRASYILGTNFERVNFIGSGNFISTGNSLANRFQGGTGDDRFVDVLGGNDIFSGGNGTDTVDFRTSVTGAVLDFVSNMHAGAASGDSYSGIEKFLGSNAAADTMTAGGTGRVIFVGGGGGDTLTGGLKNDQLIGGAGNDMLVGGAGRDTLDGGTGNDTMTGGSQGDVFVFVDAAFGQDTIADYQDGIDSFKLFSAVADDIGDFIIAGNGTTSVTLTLTAAPANFITVNGAAPITIAADDFVFY